MSTPHMADTPQEQLTPASSATLPAQYDREEQASYKRISQNLDLVRKIIALHGEGLSQALIAQQVGCHASSVNRIINKLATDTSDLAQSLAKATALNRATRLASWTKTRDKVGLDAAKHLDNLAGLTSSNSGGSPQVLVQIGVNAAPVPTASGAKVVVTSARVGEGVAKVSGNAE